LVSLMFGLNQGHNWGWTSPYIHALLIGGLVLLFLFVVLEQRVSDPLLDLTLFRRTEFSMSVASAVLNYIPIYTILFLMPFYLIQGRGVSPGTAGTWLMIQPAIMAVASPISGILSDRIGTRRPSAFGMALLGTGLFLLSRLGPESPMTYVGFALGVSGLGTGIFIAPNNSALMGAAPANRQGMASGVLATSRYVGMILGIGIAGAIFTTFLTRGTSAALFEGIRASFFVASIAGFLGCLTSSVRKEKNTPGDDLEGDH